jgi:LacI family transcriptional regulator
MVSNATAERKINLVIKDKTMKGSKKMPTLKDVAIAADVSLSTVSLVLSGKGKISDEIRNRVIKATTAVGYQKKTKVLKENGKKLVGIIATFYEEWNFTLDFTRRGLQFLEEHTLEIDCVPILIPIFKETSRKEILNRILFSGVEAVFSNLFEDEKIFRNLEELGIPVIVVNNENLQNQFCTVCSDNIQGTFDCTEYLIKLGHRKITFADFPRPRLRAIVANRYYGFKKAVEEYNLPFTPNDKITIELDDYNGLKKTVKQVFCGKGAPTAVVAHDDYMGYMVILALQEMNLKVPEDVSIIAPGDALDYKKEYYPQITTFQIDNDLLAKIAVDILQNRLKNKHGNIQVLKIKQQLVERGSCRQIAKKKK